MQQDIPLASNQEVKYFAHLNHPDKFKPTKVPTEYPVPSHLINSYDTRQIQADQYGKLAVYFCPMALAWVPMIQNKLVYNYVDQSFGLDAFYFYADHCDQSGTAKDVYGQDSSYAFNMVINSFNNISAWPFGVNKLPGTEYARKIKVVAGQLQIYDVGRKDMQQGVFQTVLGFKTFASNMILEGVKPDQFDDFPQFQMNRSDEGVVVNFKPTDSDCIENWGPYTPYKSIPYHVIYGTGLSPFQSFQVEYTITLEVVVDPEVKGLVNPQKEWPSYKDQFQDLAKKLNDPMTIKTILKKGQSVLETIKDMKEAIIEAKKTVDDITGKKAQIIPENLQPQADPLADPVEQPIYINDDKIKPQIPDDPIPITSAPKQPKKKKKSSEQSTDDYDDSNDGSPPPFGGVLPELVDPIKKGKLNDYMPDDQMQYKRQPDDNFDSDPAIQKIDDIIANQKKYQEKLENQKQKMREMMEQMKENQKIPIIKNKYDKPVQQNDDITSQMHIEPEQTDFQPITQNPFNDPLQYILQDQKPKPLKMSYPITPKEDYFVKFGIANNQTAISVLDQIEEKLLRDQQIAQIVEAAAEINQIQKENDIPYWKIVGALLGLGVVFYTGAQAYKYLNKIHRLFRQQHINQNEYHTNTFKILNQDHIEIKPPKINPNTIWDNVNTQENQLKHDLTQLRMRLHELDIYNYADLIGNSYYAETSRDLVEAYKFELDQVFDENLTINDVSNEYIERMKRFIPDVPIEVKNYEISHVQQALLQQQQIAQHIDIDAKQTGIWDMIKDVSKQMLLLVGGTYLSDKLNQVHVFESEKNRQFRRKIEQKNKVYQFIRKSRYQHQKNIDKITQIKQNKKIKKLTTTIKKQDLLIKRYIEQIKNKKRKLRNLDHFHQYQIKEINQKKEKELGLKRLQIDILNREHDQEMQKKINELNQLQGQIEDLQSHNDFVLEGIYTSLTLEQNEELQRFAKQLLRKSGNTFEYQYPQLHQDQINFFLSTIWPEMQKDLETFHGNILVDYSNVENLQKKYPEYESIIRNYYTDDPKTWNIKTDLIKTFNDFNALRMNTHQMTHLNSNIMYAKTQYSSGSITKQDFEKFLQIAGVIVAIGAIGQIAMANLAQFGEIGIQLINPFTTAAAGAAAAFNISDPELAEKAKDMWNWASSFVNVSSQGIPAA